VTTRTRFGWALAFGLTALAGCRNHDFPKYPVGYREFAYVTNGGSNTVSVFDVVNVRLDREIQVGQNPTGVAANPKRNEVYVVNSGTAGSNGSVSVIDTEKNVVAATIPVHRQPYFIEVDPAGEVAYVANSGSNSVSIVDLKARREVGSIPVGNGPGLARISADGKTLLVTNRTGNNVSLVDVAQRQVRKVIDGCPGATDAVILPDSRKAFVACSAAHQIMAIALASVADPKKPERGETRSDAPEALLDVGKTPVHLALKPDGGEVFVSNYDSDSISEVVTGTNDVGGSYLMGSHPVRGLVSSDNSLLYVSNFSSQEITVYSIDDGKRTASIHVGDGPDAMAFSSSGHLLFAVDARSSDVAVIRTRAQCFNRSGLQSLDCQSLFTLLPTGRQPNAIAVKAFKVQ